MSQDEDHLKLLSIFHYVAGGLATLFSFFPSFHLIIGLFLIFGVKELEARGDTDFFVQFVGWVFVILASMFMLIGFAMAGSMLAAGRYLHHKKHYVFCLAVAAVECIFFPFGTALGIFTIIVLTRESVKRLFNAVPLTPAAS
jgi:hypothetical protein